MKLPLWLGSILYIIGWPAIWLGLRGSRRAYILIICKDEALVIKSWLGVNRKWHLPGGGLHKKETPIDGALRELKEELNIQLTSDKCKLVIESQKSNQINYDFWVYKCDFATKPSIELSFDTILYQWVSVKELNKQQLSEELDCALKLV